MTVEIVTGWPAFVAELDTWDRPITICTDNPRFVAWITTRVGDGTIGTILTDDRTVRQVTEIDYLEWQLADRYERGDLEVRILDGHTIPAIAMNHASVLLLVDIAESPGGVISHEATELHHRLHHHVERLLGDASIGSPAAPGFTAVKNAFVTQFSSRLADRLFECLDVLWPDQLDGNEYDAIAVATIVVADDHGWLSDLGTWGRTTGIATEADFSRAKRTLEEDGIIQVFERSDGVGRPRHQLALNTEVLADAKQPELQLIAEVLT